MGPMNCYDVLFHWNAHHRTIPCASGVTLQDLSRCMTRFQKNKLNNHSETKHTKLSAYHYSDVTMNDRASQITGVSIAFSTVCSYQRTHQTSTPLPFVRWIPLEKASNTEHVSIWWRHIVLWDIRYDWCKTHETSSNRNIFRVTGRLCWEFTGHRWIPHTKASDAERWCFLWSVPE